MGKRKIATVISRVCEPMIMLTITAVIAGVHAHLSSDVLLQYLVFLLLFMITPILGLWVWFVQKEGLTWDIPDRAKRIRPLFIVLAFVALDLVFTLQLQSRALTQLFLIFFIWVVGFTAMTTKRKISGHTGVAALATGLIIGWYGWAWWPILFIVPIIGWARVVRGDHTVLQVVVGAFYSWGLLAILSKFFNF